MAIVFAVQKWRHYLLGRRFLVRTDQKSLKFLLEQREINMEYQRWLTKLLGFEFDIVYKPGMENKAADALSRKTELTELFAVSVSTALQLEEIGSEVDKDEELQRLISELKEDPSKHLDYAWVQGRLLRQGKLVLPKDSPLVGMILKEHHDSKMAGHGGMLKTQKRIGELFYWKGMMTDIRRYVQACQTCQRQKYGREPPALIRYENGSTANAELEEQLMERDRMIEVIREQLQRTQQLMKERADTKRREVEFEVGDMVLVKIRPYRQRSLAKRINEKLSARFYGPFEVLAKVGRVAYKLKLTEGTKIHPTFHVSQLKKIVGELVETVEIPEQLTSEGVLDTEPEVVVRKRQNEKTLKEEVLVKWKGLPSHDCTWEEVSAMKDQFPGFDLEDKVNFEGECIDTYEAERPPILFHYRRRGQAKGE